MLKSVVHLVQKELSLEWRNKYTLGGLILYVTSTIFVAYLSFKKLDSIPAWNALFWIIQLFAATNAIGKSFVQDGEEQHLYLYTLVPPQAIILSKIIYNAILVSFLTIVGFFLYTLFINDPIQDHGMFFTAMLLGSLGFSSTLTLVAGIASQSGNNLVLMSILGFPIILPLLMTLIAFSKNAIDGIAWSVNLKYVVVLGGLNVIVVALSYLLFPYLWRD